MTRRDGLAVSGLLNEFRRIVQQKMAARLIVVAKIDLSLDSLGTSFSAELLAIGPHSMHINC